MHPRLGLALRTAIAGGLAWLVTQVLPDHEAQQYAYFAPMGAVVVTSTTVVATARALLQAVAALALGSALGLLALAVVRPDAISVAVVIAVSVILAGWKPLGSMRAWVPTVAVFNLVLGGGQPWQYASAYTGLSALGAAIGATVVALIPQFVIAPLDDAVHRLWLSISERLGQLSEALRDEDRDGPFGSSLADDGSLDSALRRVDERLAEVRDARRANRRSRRYDVKARVGQAEAIRKAARRLQDFQRRLEDSDPGSLSELVGDAEESAILDQRLADVIDLIHRSLQQGSVEDLDESLEPTLARLDELVSRYPSLGPGQHIISSLIFELRQLALAAREAVARSVKQG